MEGKLHLEVDDSVSPVVMPPRRVPVALKGKFKEQIYGFMCWCLKSRRAN